MEESGGVKMISPCSSSSSPLTDSGVGANVESADLALTWELVGVSIDSLSLDEVLVLLRAKGGSTAPPPLRLLVVSLAGGVSMDSLLVEAYSLLSGVRTTPPCVLTVLVASLSSVSNIDAESLGAMEEAVDDPAMLMPANRSACPAMVIRRSVSWR